MPWRRVMRARGWWRSDKAAGRGLSDVWRTVRIRPGACALVLLALWPAVADAQTTLNPSTVEFTPSADHAVTLPTGEPAVTSYRFEIWVQGATAAWSSVPLDKPTPEADGKIRATPALLLAVPVGQIYVAHVVAVGPAGEGRSDPSNAFTRADAPRSPVNVRVGGA